MLNVLLEFAEFFRRFQLTARFGALSRERLRLLRIAVEGNRAECQWIARVPDKWDAELPRVVGRRNESLQALRDALAVRELLLRILPQARSATLRIYREGSSGERELVIAGETTREDRAGKSVKSVVMQAKLLGLHFEMIDGILQELQQEFCTEGLQAVSGR